jgi:hypothetical protein
LIVVVSQVRLDGRVLEEFLSRPRQVLFPVVRDSQIEVDKRKFGIGFGGEVEFLDGLVILLTVDVGLAQQEMQLGRILAGFGQYGKGPLLEVGPRRLAGGDA